MCTKVALNTSHLYSLLRCVIAELFTEGTPPFDLSQLLSYRTGEYSPHELYHKIEDFNIRVSPVPVTVKIFSSVKKNYIKV